jgi:hypothetical protein
MLADLCRDLALEAEASSASPRLPLMHICGAIEKSTGTRVMLNRYPNVAHWRPLLAMTVD